MTKYIYFTFNTTTTLIYIKTDNKYRFVSLKVSSTSKQEIPSLCLVLTSV